MNTIKTRKLLTIQRTSLVIWVLTVIVFIYCLFHTTNFNGETNTFTSTIAALDVVIGITAFIVMILSAVMYSAHIKKEKKATPKRTLEISTLTKINPLIWLGIILMILLVFILGRLSVNQKPQQIIIQQPAQQAPQVIIKQAPPQIQIPKTQIENTNCYMIGSQLHCNTITY